MGIAIIFTITIVHLYDQILKLIDFIYMLYLIVIQLEIDFKIKLS